jgi:limonene-1,2-epoxide hydrolase
VAGALETVERVIRALNDHDLETMLEQFDADYRSEQPAHPARTFRGIDQVRQNWSALLDALPDVRWEIIRSAERDDTAWIEARLTGTRADGTRLEEIGVVLFGVARRKIAWGRLYLEEIEAGGGDIDATVRQMAGGTEE